MGLEFLARVRRTSVWFTLGSGLLVATYRGIAEGSAVLLGAAWCLVNLFLLEKLIVALTGADRGRLPAVRRAAWSGIGMLGLFAAGALLLTRLPAIWLLMGFWIPFAVMVLKAASLLLIPTDFWRRFTRGKWGAAAAVAVFVIGAWLATGGWTGSHSRDAHPVRLAQSESAHASSGAHASAPHETEEAEESGPQKFPNFITVLVRANPHQPWAHQLHRFEAIVFSFLIALLLCIAAFVASRRRELIPTPFQNVVEWLVESLYDFVVGILGPKHGPRYLPFLGSLFVYILAMNLFGLIPFMDSPTSSLNITVALALVVFIYAQWIGFRELGFVGYFDHLMGSPRTVIGWILVPLMLPIHVMGELAKPISLSCRLFGNIFGEDMLLVAFATLGITTLSKLHSPVGLPLQLPFMFLALLTSTLQALVFTVLSTIYFLLMLPHDDHEHEGEAQHAH
jgi:F-type H+-transporting ATPase subunit a